jgi:hypothetical protein
MKKIEILLKTIEKKKVLFLVLFTISISSYINLLTKEKLENGYEFFLSFLSYVLYIYSCIFLMLVFNAQQVKKPKEPFRFFSSNFIEQRKSKDPFYLMRYISYLFLFLFAIAPFIYLWSMQDVIMQLNWNKPFSR